MSLISCPDCHNDVGQTAFECPTCGCNIQAYLQKIAFLQQEEIQKKKFRNARFILLIVVGLIIWGIAASNKSSDSNYNSSSSNQYTSESDDQASSETADNPDSQESNDEVQTEQNSVHVLNAQNIKVKSDTEMLFKIYAPEIEKSNDALIDTKIILTGDLNSDGLDDAIVWFLLVPASGGNMILDTQMAIYLNSGAGMEVVAGFNPEKMFHPVVIKENIIHLIENDYAEGDHHNRPSIEKHKYYRLAGNKLVETRMP